LGWGTGSRLFAAVNQDLHWLRPADLPNAVP